jgi:4-hydroxyacetophenone monooxygenase
LISAISDNVGELTVFMRTRYWTIYNPEINAEVSDGMMFALRYIPHFREWFRFRVYWFAADGLYSNVVKDPKRPVDSPSVSALNEGMRQYALSQLEAKFADRPGLKEKMTPDFPIFSKSIILDAGWLDAFREPHVMLEDAASAPNMRSMSSSLRHVRAAVQGHQGFGRRSRSPPRIGISA